jgi:hypothetical protein
VLWPIGGLPGHGPEGGLAPVPVVEAPVPVVDPPVPVVDAPVPVVAAPVPVVEAPVPVVEFAPVPELVPVGSATTDPPHAARRITAATPKLACLMSVRRNTLRAA